MNRKLTWLACALASVLIVAPALIAQTTWVVSDDDDDASSSYTLFGMDDSAFLGVTMEEETEHEEGGARINSVVEGSPAEKAGLQEGDIVIGFGKNTIRGPVGLTKKIRAREPGDEIEITVLRDGRKRSFNVELGERSSYSTQWSYVAPRVLGQLQNMEIPALEFDMEELQDQLKGLNLEGLKGLQNLEGYTLFDNEDWPEALGDFSKSFTFNCEDGECDYSRFFYTTGRPRLGVQLTETTPELREHLGGTEDAGVLVSKVIEDSAAEDAGVEVGDLIVDVDGDEISSTSDLRKALAERDGETFDIEVIRGGRSVQLSVTLEADDEERPTGPRAYRRVPRPTAPAIVAPRIAPMVVPRIAPRVAPQIRERVRLAPAVVEIDATASPVADAVVAPAPPSVVAVPTAPAVALAPVAVTVPTAPAVVVAPLAVTVPTAPAAVVPPGPATLPVPEVHVAPVLVPLPELPAPPSPAVPAQTKDDVI